MAVAAAQKRAAVSAPAEVSANGTPEPQNPTASAPLQQMPHGSRLGADALDRSARSEVERVSPDTDAASIVGEALSQRALSDNNGSVDKSGYFLLPATTSQTLPFMSQMLHTCSCMATHGEAIAASHLCLTNMLWEHAGMP